MFRVYQVLLLIMEQLNDVDEEMFSALNLIKNTVDNEMYYNLTQSKITNYFV